MKSIKNEHRLAYNELCKHLNGKENFVNLPKTSFPLRASADREVNIQEEFDFAGLYTWQKRRSSVVGQFCLHDGPPYANGEPHIGHFLNKILKDIVCRYKMMAGHRVHFIPGWDCHGLPVELKALTGVSDFRKLTPLNIREKARSIAEQQISRQMQAFKRWGVMADFKNEIYCTFHREYEANQIGVFHQMYEKGCIYRGFKPIYWSPSSKTALAEAELEYKDLISQALYFKLPLQHPSFNNSDKPPNLLLWTTTPWTLPANEAICYNPKIKYCLAKALGQTYIFALNTKIGLEKEVFRTDLEVLCVFEGSFLRGSSYTHPIFPERACPLLPASHVTESSGTGLVHTAPAHGPDDYLVCKENNINIECGIDEDGKYTDLFGTELQGKDILSEGNLKVLSMMKERGLVVSTNQYTHRCPHDWRTREPVFLRATPQWFANVSNLIRQAEEVLNGVTMLPAQGKHILLSHLEGRKDWCISRQRCWGVPIPVFYSEDHTPLISPESVEQIRTVFRREGSDAWWKLPTDAFLTLKVLKSFGKSSCGECTRQGDTLDVWFDSGTSWATVLKDVDGVADLCIEGSDQHRGWFQSSLLTSVASRGIAPFKTVITHGFVLDANNQKMSKSLGNVTDPDDLINGNKSKKILPYGVDVVRLWVASSDYTKDISIGIKTLDQFSEKYRKVRNTLRFMSGNLDEFVIREDGVTYEELYDIDKYMLHLLHKYLSKVDAAYESYSLPTVAKQMVEMCTLDLSAFYFLINKDRLYLHDQFGTSRKGCQTTLYTCMYQILKSIAPILPHLAEELVKHHSIREIESIFQCKEWFAPKDSWENYEVADRWELLRNMKHSINQWLATQDIMKPLGYYITITLPDGKVFQELKFLQEEVVSNSSPLNDVMGTSITTLKRHEADKVHTDEAKVEDSFASYNFFIKHPKYSDDVPVRIDLSNPTAVKCQRCWKHVAVEKYCETCVTVMMQYVKRRSSSNKADQTH